MKTTWAGLSEHEKARCVPHRPRRRCPAHQSPLARHQCSTATFVVANPAYQRLALYVHLASSCSGGSCQSCVLTLEITRPSRGSAGVTRAQCYRHVDSTPETHLEPLPVGTGTRRSSWSFSNSSRATWTARSSARRSAPPRTTLHASPARPSRLGWTRCRPARRVRYAVRHAAPSSPMYVRTCPKTVLQSDRSVSRLLSPFVVHDEDWLRRV